MYKNQEQLREVRSYSSLESQLHRQIKFLETSSKLFDEGDEDEAVRLATTIRVLLHDSDNPKSNSKSLLRQLGIKENLEFLNTGVYPDDLIDALNGHMASNNVLNDGSSISSYAANEVGLVSLDIKDKKWVAPLSQPRINSSSHYLIMANSLQKFDAWWTKPLIQGETKIFSRKQLIGIMCDQDGGAHVDATLDKSYLDLTLDNLGFQWAAGENLPDMLMTNENDYLFESAKSNIAAASVRQIVYEVLITLKKISTPLPRV